MDLRCKVLRAGSAPALEAEVNRFLEELDESHEAQLEDISQSEGPDGITITIWYTLLEELEEPDEATLEGEAFVRIAEAEEDRP